MSAERRYPAVSQDVQARGLAVMLRIFGPGALSAAAAIDRGDFDFFAG